MASLCESPPTRGNAPDDDVGAASPLPRPSPESAGRPASTPRRTFAPLRGIAAVLPAVALGAALLAVWQLIAMSGAVSSFLLPAPAEVTRAFWQAMASGLLPSYTLVTLQESLAGFVAGALVALPLGYAIARSRLLSRALEPYLAASQAIPAVALAPVLVLWLGYGLLPVAALCALIVFFPTVVTTALGIRLLDRDVLDAARTDGAGHWALLWQIELPLALPSILAGLRTSLTLSITGAVVGEFVLGDQGLGGLLNIARGQYDAALVFATLAMLALLASLLYLGARFVERRVLYLEGA